MSDPTPRHPIRVVAQRTGLTPATLRAWERRYDVVQPGRSEGGQRLYSDDDVERLSQLRELIEVGRPISMVAALPVGEMHALLDEDRAAAAHRAETQSAQAAEEQWIARAFADITALDSEALDTTLRRAALNLGAMSFLDDVATPLLERVGLAWVNGEVTPAQEHLGSDTLEKVIHWLTAPLAEGVNGPTLLVATLPGERHGLGARMVAASAALEGWNVTYLGIDLPVADIAMAAEEVGASAVALSVVLEDRLDDVARSLVVLRELLEPAIGVLVGGRAARALTAVPPGVTTIDGLVDLREELRRRR